VGSASYSTVRRLTGDSIRTCDGRQRKLCSKSWAVRAQVSEGQFERKLQKGEKKKCRTLHALLFRKSAWASARKQGYFFRNWPGKRFYIEKEKAHYLTTGDCRENNIREKDHLLEQGVLSKNPLVDRFSAEDGIRFKKNYLPHGVRLEGKSGNREISLTRKG